jgi:hypothetical protein
MKEFEVTSGKIVCSDPCYTTDTWCMGVVDNVVNGTWVASVEKRDLGDWGERIAILWIANKEQMAKNPKICWEVLGEEPMNFIGGVDSGQFGFFDFEDYRNDDNAKNLKKYDFGAEYDREEGDAWYRACSDLTLSDESWGVLPKGVVSSSGIGDGSYDVFGYKDAYDKYVAFGVVFIYDGDEEDEGDVCGVCNENDFDCTC